MRETEVEDQLPSIYKRLRSIQIANAALIYYLKIKGHSVSMIACAKRPAVQVVDSSGVFPCYMGQPRCPADALMGCATRNNSKFFFFCTLLKQPVICERTFQSNNGERILLKANKKHQEDLHKEERGGDSLN